jgi:hypothetical protein
VLTHGWPSSFLELTGLASRPGHRHARGRRYLDEEAAWFADAGGYEHEQMTRPRTLACPAPYRHQSAPDAMVPPHPDVSNKEPNAPLEPRTRAHRTPT